LKVEESLCYKWNDKSTYIHNPPFFKGIKMELPEIKDIEGAYILAFVGDKVNTD
jgi:aconitate hydratase